MPDPPHHLDAAHWSSLNTANWYAARNATTALRDALVRAGMERDFPYLRADLNACGTRPFPGVSVWFPLGIVRKRRVA